MLTSSLILPVLLIIFPLSVLLVVYLVILIDIEIFSIKFKITARKTKKKLEDMGRNGLLNEGVVKYIENTFRNATQELEEHFKQKRNF